VKQFHGMLNNALTILSGILGVFVMGLWIGSSWIALAIGWTAPNFGAAGVVLNNRNVTLCWGPSVPHGGSARRAAGLSHQTWRTENASLKYHPLPGKPIPQIHPAHSVWTPPNCMDGWLDDSNRANGGIPAWVAWEHAGFRLELNRAASPGGPANITSRHLLTPPWFAPLLILVTAALPFSRLWSRHRARRAWRKGRCGVCNYNLHATPNRCPECGATPPST
jgi:hypothetical protein